MKRSGLFGKELKEGFKHILSKMLTSIQPDR